jgi:mediator of RNA polymerase II transcription subunit 12
MSLIRPCLRDDFEKSLSFIDTRDWRLKRCVDNVLQRQKAVEFSGFSANPTPKEIPENPTLLEALDRAFVPFNAAEIYRKYAYSLRQPQLIRSVCEWAVTSLRAGAYRVYLVASLLRSAYHDGINIQDPIMDFLGAFTLPRTKTSREDVYLLISELVRGRVFSVAAYMKWLIARGSLTNLGSLEVVRLVQATISTFGANSLRTLHVMLDY